jgi:phosphotransferase system enzyme I (PtsP)
MLRTQPLTGSRRLLARVRDMMAGDASAQNRLDQIVSIIAADMVAEVCSVYLLRAGEVLELFAATGLKPEAVHLTRLQLGEGLIGTIAAQARGIADADVQNHPAFVFRPETGEEIYHSMLGVPVLRGGRVLGVLAVQNRTRRQYTVEEIETLETVAMVLAELLAGGELISRDELQAADSRALEPKSIDGVRLNAGLGMGFAVLHERHLPIDRFVAEDTNAERRRLDRAVVEMHGAIDEMLDAIDLADEGEHRDVLETYRMIAEDAGWLSRIREAIGTGLTAEAAVQKVHNETRVRLSAHSDPYIRERLHDFDDLAHRLMQHLLGRVGRGASQDQPEEMILVARNMGPAELLDYDRVKLRGLVLEEGSATTHVAIVARALDVPVVGRVAGLLDAVAEGDLMVVDGDNAQVHIRPAEDIHLAFVEILNARAQQRAAYAALRDEPAKSTDGVVVSLNLNAGLIADMQSLEETGADGIGLYRTEIPFMERRTFPDVNEQAELYERIFDLAHGKPVVFRTLDVGSDKRLPYWNIEPEENPALGWRALRVALDRPAMLRHQLRALIRAAKGRPLSIMFPMVAETAEFEEANALLDREVQSARKIGRVLPEKIEVGTMLEVPALAFQMASLLKRVDFVSVGSNDLFQFLFASDRGNPRLADRYDPLSPGALSFLRHLVVQCDAAGVPISLCGEMAGRPLDAMALVGIGFRSLSVAPSAVGPVKSMIRGLSVSNLSQYMESLFDQPGRSVREKLREFAIDHGVGT